MAGKKMTQSEIIGALATSCNLKKTEAKQFLDEIASLAATEVKNSGEFTLPGVGKLVLSHRKAREGRNPATGEPIKIAAKTTLKFRVGKGMKDAAGVK
jgi:DNA-binding protein HU-beta